MRDQYIQPPCQTVPKMKYMQDGVRQIDSQKNGRKQPLCGGKGESVQDAGKLAT